MRPAGLNYTGSASTAREIGSLRCCIHIKCFLADACTESTQHIHPLINGSSVLATSLRSTFFKTSQRSQQYFQTSPQAKRHELSLHVTSFCFLSFLFVSRHFFLFHVISFCFTPFLYTVFLSSFDHQVAPLVLVLNLTTRWPHIY